jgi:hypothetical protein
MMTQEKTPQRCGVGRAWLWMSRRVRVSHQPRYESRIAMLGKISVDDLDDGLFRGGRQLFDLLKTPP